jgi:hypothetical protein
MPQTVLLRGRRSPAFESISALPGGTREEVLGEVATASVSYSSDSGSGLFGIRKCTYRRIICYAAF